MKKYSLRWLYVLCVLLALAVTGLAVPGHAALAQRDKELITLEGTIVLPDEDLIWLEVTDVTAPEDGPEALPFGEGDSLILAPAGAFQPSRLNEGDEVRVTGRLLPDGETFQVETLEVLVSADDTDEDLEDDADEGDDEEGEEDVRARCSAADSHPVAEKLADAFEVEPDWVMDQFCQGFGFGEIKLALRIAEKLAGEEVDEEDFDLEGMAEDLLNDKSKGQGWGNIIRAHKLSPSEVNPGLGGGKPEDAGQPEGTGKPENPGRPEDPGSQGQGHGRGRGK